jgi:HemY protein
MVRAILAFILIAAVLFAGNWLLDHPGSVAIELPGYFSIDWSFARTAMFLIILLVVFALLVWLVYSLARAPWRIVHRMERGRRERGYQAVSLGMVAVAAGDAPEARRQSQRADRLLPSQPMTTLLAAQSAQLDGDHDAAQRFFSELAQQPDASFLGLRGLWMQAMKDGRTRDALHYAEQASAKQPNSGWVLDSLFELQTQLGQWDEAAATAKAIAKAKLHPAEQIRRNEALVNIERSRSAASRGDYGNALGLAQAAHKALPEFVPAAAQVAEMHVKNGRRGRAEKVIQAAWRTRPHPMLAEAYRGVVDTVPREKQLRLAKSLAELAPDHPESRILTAKFAMAADDWDEARKALEPLIRREPSARVCRLMAEIELRQNDDRAIARDWIARSALAEPDEAWVCAETGAVQADWSAVCTASKRFGTLEWKVPPHLTPATAGLLDLTPATERTVPAVVTPGSRSKTVAPVVHDVIVETEEETATSKSEERA